MSAADAPASAAVSGPVPARGPRFVFIAGLHRSGTSLLAKLLAAHPEISAIENSPAPENEGCYLQGAIPHTARHGIPGHYATDPAQHHIEGCSFDTLATRERMLAGWAPWFDPASPWWLEKSPVNLTRMRLYQQLFPMSQFVVILRHPQVLACAMRKWVDRPEAELIDYALSAYERVAEDARYLHAITLLRYEDLIAAPQATLAGLSAFLDLPPHTPQIELRNGNADYAIEGNPARAVAARLARWGYGDGGQVGRFEPLVSHLLRAVRESTAAALIAGENDERLLNFGLKISQS